MENLRKLHAFNGGNSGLKFSQNNGVVTFLGEDIDPETGLISKGVGKVTGTGVQQVCQESFVIADQIQGENLGLKRGKLEYWRLYLYRHEYAGGLHLQWLANRQVQVRNIWIGSEHGRDPVIDL